ncbi:MAG: PIN domain-containing protein [Epsilonproteobacteria bacterium]|nr:MAG: PIN domain-containing protein [Campylobacterota bacterium]
MVKNKIFLDTNIVADIIHTSRLNHNQSLKLLKQLILNNYEICISEDIITTLYYILKDKKTTLEFLENVIFIDWTILIFGKSVLEKGVQLSLEKNIDLEDVLQCLCAKENDCDAFITHDKKFYDCGIKIMSSEAFYINYVE